MLGGTGEALAKLELFLPTNDPSSLVPVTHSRPCTWSETSDVVLVAVAGEGGEAKLLGGILFSNLIVKQSPTFARNTIGRGLLSARSCLPNPPTVSRLSAKIIPPGMAAPSRFSIMGWGRATTSASITRLHWAGVGSGFAATTFSPVGSSAVAFTTSS